MMLTCQEFSRLVASDELRELSFRLRLEARVHAWLCRHCRRYRKQILSLGSAARRAWTRSEEDPAETEALSERILERIREAQRTAVPEAGDPTEPEY